MLTSSRPRRLPVLVASAASVACAALLAGCSGSVSVGSSYDEKDLAQAIVAEQQKAVPDLDVTDGTCPAGEDLEVGTKLDCSVSVAGVTAPYTAEVTSIEDGTANFSFSPAQAILLVSTAEDFLGTQLTDQGITDATVSCGDEAVLVQDPDTTFVCTVSYSDGTTQDVTGTVTDLDGNVTFG